MSTVIHTCPRCDLRFLETVEMLDHLRRDHPEPAQAEPAQAEPRPAGRIVVPVDPTQPPPVAASVARVLAGQLGTAIEVVAASPPGLPEQTTEVYLRARAHELRRAGVPWVGWQTLAGDDPASALLGHVEATHPTLVCIGTRARTALGEALFGSVTLRVVSGSPVPVVVVGPEASQPETRFTRVVVCVDRSDRAAHIVDVGRRLAESLATRLVLVEVLPPVAGDGAPDDDSHLRGLLGPSEPDVVTQILHGSRPATVIHDFIGDDETTLLVTGRRGESEASRFVVGSVVMGLARHVRGPVVVVPPSARLMA